MNVNLLTIYNYMFLVGRYLECLWTVDNKPQVLALLMAFDNFFWFLALHPVISLGKIWPVELKNLDKISGMVYMSNGSTPAFWNGSTIFSYGTACLLSLFSMSILSFEKSNGSYVSLRLNFLVNGFAMLIGGCVFSCNDLAIPTTLLITELLLLEDSFPAHDSLLFISGVDGSDLL